MDPSFIREYETYERQHWWFRARSKVIRSALQRYVPGTANGEGRWLDVGCGTGVLLEAHSGFAEKVGADCDAHCVKVARSRGLNVHQTGIGWNFSGLGPFDCITLCDVLEHVEDEASALQAVRAALKDDGILLITVPALKGLWSDHDVVNHHFRRYRRSELLQRFAANDWDLLKISYFSTLLFPAIWSIRQCKTLGKRLRRCLPGRAARPEPPSHHLKFGNRRIDMRLNASSASKPRC